MATIADEVKYKIDLARMQIEEAMDKLIGEDGLVLPGWESINASLDHADGKLLGAHSECEELDS